MFVNLLYLLKQIIAKYSVTNVNFMRNINCFILKCSKFIGILLLLRLYVVDSFYFPLIILQYLFTTFGVPDVLIKKSKQEI